MKNNNLEILEKVISSYMKKLDLYVINDRESSNGALLIGYVCKGNRKITTVSFFKSGTAYFNMSETVLKTFLDVLGLKANRFDIDGGTNSNLYHVAKIVKTLLIDKINQYFLSVMGYKLISYDKCVMTSVNIEGYKQDNPEKKINLY